MTCGMPIKSFVGLKGKISIYITKDKHECKKAKGINNSVAEDELKYENYKSILLYARYVNHEMNTIQR